MYLLDSNILIYLLTGIAPRLRERVQRERPGSLVTSSIVLAELAIGSRRRGEGLLQLAALTRSIPALPFDAAAAIRYAELPFKRNAFDHLIAAHALALGATIVTNNPGDFAAIAGLAIENWVA